MIHIVSLDIIGPSTSMSLDETATFILVPRLYGPSSPDITLVLRTGADGLQVEHPLLYRTLVGWIYGIAGSCGADKCSGQECLADLNALAFWNEGMEKADISIGWWSVFCPRGIQASPPKI